MTEADLLRKIHLDDIIKDFADINQEKRTLKCKCMFSLSMKDKVQ